MEKRDFQVLLFYKYIEVANPEKERDEQFALCQKLGIKGRIIIAKEGINGTLEGTKEATEKYIKEMNKNKYFSNITYKKSVGNGNAFPKLSVKVRPEIVTTKIHTLNPTKITGKYLSSEELHNWFEEKREFYIVDMRNDYEYASGYFEGSIFSGIHNFFDLHEVLPRLEHLRNKTIVTVCTGGIRCEKASGFLVENGFADVYQLKDGIQTYMEKYPNQNFKGKLYVFDGRMTIGFNTESPEHEIVGRCDKCNEVCDSYVNCEYDMCHRHYICCTECLDKDTGLAFCDDKCKKDYLTFQLPKENTSQKNLSLSL
ncbi:MAG TPA: rhodanese-related sulfurtransferase [Patescibacteria group bacterium]